MNDELKHDPEISDALRQLEGDVPHDAVNWDLLHRRILQRAGLDRETVKRTLTWLDYTARWARTAIPLALAAILVLLVWLPGRLEDEDPSAVDIAMGHVTGREALTLALTGEVTDHEMVEAVVGPTEIEWIDSGTENQ